MPSETKTTITIEEAIAKAIREEIVRQYREDERGKCPAGRGYYEEHISPWLIAKKAIAIALGPAGNLSRTSLCGHGAARIRPAGKASCALLNIQKCWNIG